MWTLVLLLTTIVSTILLTLLFLSLVIKATIVAVSLTLFSTITVIILLIISLLLLVTVIALILLASFCLLFGTGFTLSLEITALRFSCYFFCFRSDWLSRFYLFLSYSWFRWLRFLGFLFCTCFWCCRFASTFGVAAGLKLAAIFAATASSTLDEWLFTSKPNSFARATTSLLSFPSSFAISYNLFLDKSCPPLLFHKRPHFLCKSSICYSQNLSRFPDCYA